jgi:hypothetical protein
LKRPCWIISRPTITSSHSKPSDIIKLAITI